MLKTRAQPRIAIWDKFWMKPETRALLDMYRDVEPSNVIVFKGLDELRAMQRDPSYRPPAIRGAGMKVVLR